MIRRARKIGALMVVVVAVASCGGGDGLRTTLAGESAHFRLWVDDGLAERAAEADSILAGLETSWRDTQTLLAMPDDGKLDYQLVTAGQLADACGDPRVAGCQIGRSIYSGAALDQHELNHAYMALRSDHRPARFMMEGIAEAIGCGSHPSLDTVPDDWRPLLAGGAEQTGLYESGYQFVRHLILTFGIGRFLSYYEQAPAGDEADIFATNFSNFWAVGLDETWAEMRATPRLAQDDVVLPLCPCSLAKLPLAAEPQGLTDDGGHPYWVVPDLTGDTAALASPGRAIAVDDCRRERLHSVGSAVHLARVSNGYFTSARALTVSRGHFVSDACETATPYSLPAELVDAGATVFRVTVERPSDDEMSVFLQLRAPAPLQLSAPDAKAAVCASCDATEMDCQPAIPGTPIAVAGDFVLRFTFPRTTREVSTAELWLTRAGAAAR